jgi:glycosyltransferase involved in cell wall biosynthesis
VSVRILRVYHAGRDQVHRARERALAAAGADVRLVVPATWPETPDAVGAEPFPVVELPVERAGDVNRHRYRSAADLRAVIAEARPDVLDLHEEPFSVAARQWLRAAPPELPVVLYTAQNIDKRLPPPFAGWERAAHRRAAALYPCSAQAASVARGKGFAGLLDVLPLGFDEALFRPGSQRADDAEVVLLLAGRLVPEKGVLDAVRVLASLARPAQLLLAGSGSAAADARALADRLGVGARVELLGRRDGEELASLYRRAHVVLVPSTATATWVEQFGRVIVEGQASGAVVAGYDSGSIAEVGGAAAALAAPGDAEGLGRRVAELLADPDELERRRRAGIELAAGRTWTRVAERQVALYRAVLAGAFRLALPESPAARRAAARREFGPSAATAAGSRPFALPVLRAGGVVPRLLGRVLDRAAELRAAQRRTSPR